MIISKNFTSGGRTHFVNRAIQTLRDAGFEDIKTSQENKRTVITVTSTQSMFSKKMRIIASLTDPRILIRGRTIENNCHEA